MIRPALTLALLMMPISAAARGLDNCEVVVAQEVVDADGGRMTVASYQPAQTFLAGVYDSGVAFSPNVESGPVRGVICVRNDLVPTEEDYPLLATGIPLTLSQDFDSADSDLLTLYFGPSGFTHRYKSDYPMSAEFKETLQKRLKDFSLRDHGLVALEKNTE